mmetsp:Transcript_340/g.828  ORF Transcript_340/g.828 Transcript_340/m.828 type:complete len:193 (-) Transcript_340:87-665(-)
MRSSEAGRSSQKVIVVGPSEAGKSLISNVLAEHTEAPSEQYRPTVGVRILEFDSEVRIAAQRTSVELWDVSGDAQYQRCWPAIKKDAVGVILVYNPEKSSEEQEVEQWFQWFPRSMGLAANQVLVLQSLRRSEGSRMPLPSKLAAAGVAQPAVVTADDLVSARTHFSQFLESVRQSVVDKQRQEEEDVMKAA